MTDGRKTPHHLRQPNRSCEGCGSRYFATKGRRCQDCRSLMRLPRPMPPNTGGNMRAFLPEAPRIEPATTKTYAEYLREQKPSKHEVIPYQRQHEDPAEVQAAIERARAVEAGAQKKSWRAAR